MQQAPNKSGYQETTGIALVELNQLIDACKRIGRTRPTYWMNLHLITKRLPCLKDAEIKMRFLKKIWPKLLIKIQEILNKKLHSMHLMS